jgi:hypothetical protein
MHVLYVGISYVSTTEAYVYMSTYKHHHAVEQLTVICSSSVIFKQFYRIKRKGKEIGLSGLKMKMLEAVLLFCSEY